MSGRSPWMRAVWELGIAGSAGVPVGLVLGVLSRLDMKLIAVLMGPHRAGEFTANGNVVGALTLQGTLELLIFAGVFPGLLAGITYVVLRPWLLPLGRWRGLVFALYLALFYGRMAFDPHNFDFRRFGEPAVNVTLFLVLYLVIGLTLPPVADALRRRTVQRPRTPGGWGLFVLVMLGAIPAVLLLVPVTGATIATIAGFNQPDDPLAVLPLQLAVATFAIGAIARLRGSVTRLSLVLLAIPLLVAATLTLRAMATILSGAPV